MTKKTGKDVVDWEKLMAAEAKEIARLERPSINKISFLSGVMTYMDSAVPDNTLDCVILANVKEHVLYTERYQSGVVHPPNCFAFGVGDEEMLPHKVVPEPQSASCESCAMFQWGSDLGGGRGKACKERRRLAVIPNPVEISEIEKLEMAVMSIPVTSVKNWANYANLISAKYGRPPWGVVTQVKLVPDAKSQFKVTFSDLGTIESSFLPGINSRIEGALSALTTPYEMEQSEPAEVAGKEKY